MQVNFNCKNCGIALDVPEQTPDSYIVTCQNCRATIGPWSSIKAAVREQDKQKELNNGRA